MQNIFGVVILYYPGSESYNNIHTYLNFVERLLVIDNSEEKAEIPKEFLNNQKIILRQDGNNKGIATGLNIAATVAREWGCNWMLTMDQDSSFEENELDNYINCFESYSLRNGVAQFGVNFENKSSSIDCNALEVTQLITSGSLVNLPVLKELGGFDENLFIDYVDTEYCLRARISNYKIVKFNHVNLNHSLGTQRQFRSFKSLTTTARVLHAPKRLYYMVRNFLYVREKYRSILPGIFPELQSAIVNRLKNNLLYNHQRMQVLKLIFIAYVDFRKGKMGKK